MDKIRQYRTSILNSFAAMLIYGSWAVYANFEHGAQAWKMAGAIQGVYAFFSTLSVTVVAQWVYTKCGRGWLGIVVGFLVSFVVMLTIPIAVHNLAGTPDILQTILPGLIWGSGYLILFLVLKERTNKLRANGS